MTISDLRGMVELVGDLDGPVATVDTAGTVTTLNASWKIGWAVGSAKRWHVAANETAVRFRLVDDMPVTVTAMRVPGGDVVSSVATVRDGLKRAVVIEFTNQTSTPVSLALAVMPRFDSQNKPTRSQMTKSQDVRHVRREPDVVRKRKSVRMREAWSRAAPSAEILKQVEVRGTTIIVNGRIAVELGQIPGGSAVVHDGDPWAALPAGLRAGDRLARSLDGCAVVVVLPLVCGVPRRVSIPIDGSSVLTRTPAEVASGWQAVVAQAASLDSVVQSTTLVWRRGIAAAILAAGDCVPAIAARAAVVLDQVGLASEADRGRAVVLEAFDNLYFTADEAVLALRALASRCLRSNRVSGLDQLAGPLVAAADNNLDVDTLEQVAAALSIEAPDVAVDARRLLAELSDAGGIDNDGCASSSLAANSFQVQHDLDRDGSDCDGVKSCYAIKGYDAIKGIESILGRLVDEHADRLVILPASSHHWARTSLDVRSLHTRHGCLSFSVRWHGSRPALLWQLSPSKEFFRSTARNGQVVQCGLAPAWSSAELIGETLLNPMD